MSIMTAAEYRQQDDYQSRYEANYLYAKDEWLNKIEPIKQSFEHLLNDTPMCDARLIDIAQIMNGYKKLFDSAYFLYEPDDDIEIEYDFYDELKAILLDEYGWEIDDV